MSRKRFANNDPYWLKARFPSRCTTAGCSAEIHKGDRIFYYPKEKRALCPACGETASLAFEAAKADEEFYNA